MFIIDMVQSCYRSFKHRMEMRSYDEYTIAEYFRKQGARIGEHCFICVDELGGEPYLIQIGNNVSISSGVCLVTHNIAWGYRHVVPDIQSFGTIVIEDNCSIGLRAIILPNVTIGRNSIIGAGVVVSTDVPPNSLVLNGRPKIFKGMVDEYYGLLDAQWQQQRPEGYMKEYAAEPKKSPALFHAHRARPHNRAMLRKHLEKTLWSAHHARTH